MLNPELLANLEALANNLLLEIHMQQWVNCDVALTLADWQDALCQMTAIVGKLQLEQAG